MVKKYRFWIFLVIVFGFIFFGLYQPAKAVIIVDNTADEGFMARIKFGDGAFSWRAMLGQRFYLPFNVENLILTLKGGGWSTAPNNLWLYNEPFTNVIASTTIVVPYTGADVVILDPIYFTDLDLIPGNYWLIFQHPTSYFEGGFLTFCDIDKYADGYTSPFYGIPPGPLTAGGSVPAECAYGLGTGKDIWFKLESDVPPTPLFVLDSVSPGVDAYVSDFDYLYVSGYYENLPEGTNWGALVYHYATTTATSTAGLDIEQFPYDSEVGYNQLFTQDLSTTTTTFAIQKTKALSPGFHVNELSTWYWDGSAWQRIDIKIDTETKAVIWWVFKILGPGEFPPSPPPPEVLPSQCEQFSFPANTICRAFLWLFVPSSASLNNFNNLRIDLEMKPPFGYVKTIIDKFQSFSTSTGTSTLDFTILAGLTAFILPVKTTIGVALWLIFGFWIFNRFRHFEL